MQTRKKNAIKDRSSNAIKKSKQFNKNGPMSANTEVIRKISEYEKIKVSNRNYQIIEINLFKVTNSTNHMLLQMLT